jgi:hypothetical protein
LASLFLGPIDNPSLSGMLEQLWQRFRIEWLAVSTAGIVLSFLGGGAVATTATAIYTTSQDRAER